MDSRGCAVRLRPVALHVREDLWCVDEACNREYRFVVGAHVHIRADDLAFADGDGLAHDAEVPCGRRRVRGGDAAWWVSTVRAMFTHSVLAKANFPVRAVAASFAESGRWAATSSPN